MPPKKVSRVNMTMTEFLNSNRPVVMKLREKLVCEELDRLSSSNFSCSKSAPEANRLISRGKQAFQSKKYDEALRYYSKGVATAPIGSRELATAFAHRSRVLYVRKRYNLCLLDINRALITNVLPEREKQFLIMVKYGSWSKLRTSYLPKAIKEKLKSRVQLRADEQQLLYDISAKIKVNLHDTDLKMDYESFDDPIWRTKFGNATLPGTSSKILAVDEHYPRRPNARQLIATENIEPGEVLFIREYLTLELRKKARHTFCAYCTLWCEALIPCPTCCREMYCSKSCCQKAHDLYHRTECDVLRRLPAPGNTEQSISSLCLRLFLTGTGQGADLANLMRDPKVAALVNGPCHNIEIHTFADNYNKYLATLSTLWNICRFDVDFHSDMDILFDEVARTINVLRRINFFDCVKSGAPKHEARTRSTTNNVQMFAALLFLQNVLIKSTNCLEQLRGELYEKNVDQPGIRTWNDIGYGVVNVHNLMNHSCDTNSGLIQNRRHLLIYSKRPILRGEQIYDVLPPSYKTETLEARRRALMARRVECSCNWPLGEDVLIKENAYLTSNKEIIEYIESLRERFARGFFFRDGSVRQGFSDEIAPAALTSIGGIRKYVKVLSATNIMCERLIEDYMRRKGNFYHLSLQRIAERKSMLDEYDFPIPHYHPWNPRC